MDWPDKAPLLGYTGSTTGRLSESGHVSALALKRPDPQDRQHRCEFSGIQRRRLIDQDLPDQKRQFA